MVVVHLQKVMAMEEALEVVKMVAVVVVVAVELGMVVGTRNTSIAP
ncbi:hypothetical protein ACP70R_021340 [Stipagrostis hirtigluma subsp. patula]